jgi:hypothetical protein
VFEDVRCQHDVERRVAERRKVARRIEDARLDTIVA